jgi:cyclophilin family peptidyl-prolyl cis-trans isomerase
VQSGRVSTCASDTRGSRFFTVTAKRARPGLSCTIFGKVTSGMTAVYEIASTLVVTNPASGEVSEPLSGEDPTFGRPRARAGVQILMNFDRLCIQRSRSASRKRKPVSGPPYSVAMA